MKLTIIAVGMLSAALSVEAGVVKSTVRVDPSIVHKPYSADLYANQEPVVLVGEPVGEVGVGSLDGGEISHAKTPQDEVDQTVAGVPAEPERLTWQLSSGLLKPQLEALVRKHLPDHQVYWGNYEGKHEWYGEASIEGETVEELLNIITSSYGKPPKGIAWYIHRNAVEFVYKNSKG